MIKKTAIKAVFEKSLQLKKNETCLILTDTPRKKIAKEFFEYAKPRCKECKLEIMKPLQRNGQEPLPRIAHIMKNCDVGVLVTTKSLSHTKARRDASQKGARIASMPGITEEIINRCLDIDYVKLKEMSIRLQKILKKSKNIRITTQKGTDITFETGKREIFHNDGGVFNKRCSFGNLPEGEVDFAPTNANGKYVIDASFPEFGKLKSPFIFEVENGVVTKIEGKRAKELKKELDQVGKKAYVIAELGIGVNPKAKITGEVLEDEKVLGTCHIAIGNNMSYGGDNDVSVHLDGVMRNPTIIVDNKKIMDKGKPLF